MSYPMRIDSRMNVCRHARQSQIGPSGRSAADSPPREWPRSGICDITGIPRDPLRSPGMSFDRISRRLDTYRNAMIDLQIKLGSIPAIAPSSGGEGEAKKAEFL